MPEEDIKSEIKSEIAKEKPRDNEGHFIHIEEPELNEAPKDPISKFIGEHTSYHKTQDDILDVHVGNPLRKITELLVDIKKQKAFSFTLKGSLGIMGVALALSVFGIFGGGKILCDKGVQTQIGVIKTLNVYDSDLSAIPVLSLFLNYFNSKEIHQRTVLVKNDESVMRLPFSKEVNFTQYQNLRIIATGNYDSCSQTLTVSDPNSLEIYPR
ncbi:MAG: hypothetical protein A3B44_03435 [Candidatus Levybacteria bacterium RIFCSPLOWO2_01_FULL_38_21]|nr:MAG: hypothetical protein A3B44_03435 [Candidatus Levybacteria bacterium RIFCSPLOWO2_01_FULL_38_21]